ncbi:MAG: ABC transporter ATP-binding protein [Candidatus Bathyarchaeia archaeon]
MSLIEVSGLVKNYGKVKALRGITFKVDKGITGLIGPNGAGKTTTIKILLGLISSDKGEATAFGLNCWKERDKILEKMGVLHEKPRFPQWVTGRKYLEYIAKIKGILRIDEEVERAVKICGLADFIDRKISTYSAGMTQRLGLADALIGNPEIVILDEPTANLDPLGRSEVLSMVKQLAKEEGVSFLISTHVLSELERICDSVVILNEGLVLEYGLVSQLVSKYASHTYVVKVNDQEKFIKNIAERISVRLEAKEEHIVVVQTENSEFFVNEVNNLVRRGVIRLYELMRLSPTLEEIFVEVLRRKSHARK